MGNPQAFRRKPGRIDAMRFDGDADPAHIAALTTFMRTPAIVVQLHREPRLRVVTSQGVVSCGVGEWVIRNAHGEVYPCRADTFEELYEPCDSPQ